MSITPELLAQLSPSQYNIFVALPEAEQTAVNLESVKNMNLSIAIPKRLCS